MKQVTVVDAAKLGLAMIDIIRSLAKVEVDNVDGVDLLHILVVITTVDILRDELRRAEEDVLEIGILRLALHLDEQQLAVLVLRLNVHTVVLGIITVFVTLTLQQTVNLNLLVEQTGEKTLQHTEVGLVAQQPLQCPVKADVCLVSHNVSFPFFVSLCCHSK